LLLAMVRVPCGALAPRAMVSLWRAAPSRIASARRARSAHTRAPTTASRARLCFSAQRTSGRPRSPARRQTASVPRSLLSAPSCSTHRPRPRARRTAGAVSSRCAKQVSTRLWNPLRRPTETVRRAQMAPLRLLSAQLRAWLGGRARLARARSQMALKPLTVSAVSAMELLPTPTQQMATRARR